MMIETERLILRPLETNDAEAIFKYARSERVGPAAGWPPHRSTEDSVRFIDLFRDKPEMYALVLKETNEAIGVIQLKRGNDTDLTDREDECELGYWIGVPHWGKGLMPEAVNALLKRAFAELETNAVWCGYYEGNERSHRVQEKCGFVHMYKTEGLFLPLLNETRTGHVSLLTRAAWMERPNGKRNSFDLIYEQVIKIPAGKVATYGQIARMAGNPRWARVVGYALHVNPKPGVIPCHRVVDRNGRLSPAFAFGGMSIQERLLEREGVEVTDGHVDLDRYRL